MPAGPRGLAHLDEPRLLASSVLGRLWKNCGSRQVLVLVGLFVFR